jgi:hypothetical protein
MTTATHPPCRHCRAKPANRPRGLCWACYYTPGIQDLYPSLCAAHGKGVADRNGGSEAPAQPTSARPGSAEKIAVLTERAARGQSLWHKGDAGMDGEGRGQPAPVAVAVAREGEEDDDGD